MAGQVLVNDTPADKPGHQYAEDVEIRLRGEVSRYVGRGGDKLEGALKAFSVDLKNVVVLDIGASTGGFTDCALQHGASHVIAVDVGYNQLDERLRRDERVTVLERTHAKDLRTEQLSPAPQFVTIDVSFISVRKVLDFIAPLLPRAVSLLVLVKPQFEAGKELVGKGGVVREAEVQEQSVAGVESHARELGFEVLGHAPSVLRGAKKGNQEYFVYLQRVTEPLAE